MNEENTVQKPLNVEKENNLATRSPCPFVKWVGGKRFLLSQLCQNLPEQYNDYYEPFVGGGALFFALHKQVNRAFLSDKNLELVITYNVVKRNPLELLEQLKEYQRNHSKEYYYQIRAQHYYETSQQHNYKDPIEIAAKFIYLNKTCYNGLFRVNKKGHFNVPVGTYKNPNIIQEENILACSEALQCAKIEYREFDTITPNEKDFVYFDPPYHPTDEISFTTYTKLDFTERDQERLRDFAVQLQKKGINVLLSNSNTRFIRGLYSPKPFTITTVHAPRFVNCKADRRNPVEEALIRGY